MSGAKSTLRAEILAYHARGLNMSRAGLWAALEPRGFKRATVDAAVSKMRASGELPRAKRRAARLVRVRLDSAGVVALGKEAERLACAPEALAATLLAVVLRERLVDAILDGDAP